MVIPNLVDQLATLIGERSSTDTYLSGVALGEDTAVSHQSMNRKCYLGIPRYDTFREVKPGLIEFPVAPQEDSNEDSASACRNTTAA